MSQAQTSPAHPTQPQANPSFSTDLPTLQIAWDSTSLGALKTCPRLYQLSILEGWSPRAQSVHLDFGLWYHAALEHYHRSKAQGQDHDSALRSTVRRTLESTWNPVLRKPWFSDHPAKNRLTLIRTIVWYLDQFKEDSFQTLILANGKPAVELSFRLQTGISSVTGEEFLLCGHLDRIAQLDGSTYILDAKTTTTTIGSDFFRKFSPDNQFSTYTLAGSVVWALPIKGIVVDGAQVAVSFSRFQRGIVERHQSQLQEWFNDFTLWLGHAQVYAQMAYWPMNDKSCSNYGGCAFRDICSKPPSIREEWLKASFTKRVWNPLQIRGDI